MKVIDHYLIKDDDGFRGVMVLRYSKQTTQLFATKKEAEDILAAWIKAESTK